MENNLRVLDLYKSYTQANVTVQVLSGITASFAQGRSYAITGMSGSGKSTLIHLLAGLDQPTRGVVLYNNQDINSFGENQKSDFLNKSLGLVFQYPYLIKELTILENVMVKGLIAKTTTSDCADQALALLHEVGLKEKAYAYPGQLSGGQQQRVALARALMNKPAFLLADEPTGNLDQKTAFSILGLIKNAQQEWGMGLIISSHDAVISQQMDEVYEVINGLLERKR